MPRDVIEKLIQQSSFTEDDVYFYSREGQDIDSDADHLLKEAGSDNPLWFLHPSDEDNRFVKLEDFIPPHWKPRGGNNSSQAQAA